jgi:phosphate transport system ATP-binding protein
MGAKINEYKGEMDDLVERSLRGAALWEEVRWTIDGRDPP